MQTKEHYTSAHLYLYEDSEGQLVDVEYFCSDYCHRNWCKNTEREYGGWHGCNEVSAPQWCAQCADEF